MLTFAWKETFVAGVLLVSLVVSASHGQPESWPTCESPQPIAPLQLAGGTEVYSRSAVAWNGQEYAVVWVDGSLHFRRFYADGTPAGAAVTPSARVSRPPYAAPCLVWNGSGYAVAWLASSDVPYDQAYFARLDASGSLIGSEVKASFAGTTEQDHCLNPVLAWSGSGYAVAWADSRFGYTDLYTTLLNGDGTIANGGLSHDILIESPVAGQVNPAMAWSSVSGRYILVWQDYRFGDTDLWGASLMPTGAVGDYHPSLVGGGGWPCNPSLVDTGNGLGFTWTDHRDGTEGEIYFARLSAYGARIGGETRLTSDIGRSGGPIIVWTGVEFGVFWHDDWGGSYDLWFQRVSASGTPMGINTQVTFTAGTQFSGAAFASRGYLASGAADGFANFVQAWGCNAPYFAPPCPENLLAYNITGSSATVSWLPAVDPTFDIAYYLVYRNNGLMGMTADNYFTDTGLSPNVTYQYAIRAVNAAQAQSSSCGTASSIYVKTNATLSLILEKNANGTDADLSWSDAGLNNYNVFRGVSPQVMQQIGATSEQTYTDPNVLVNANIYFYTVDDPGG